MTDDPPGIPDGAVRADLLVAGVAAAGAVLLSVASAILHPIPVLPRLAPVGVYLAYLLLGSGSTGSRIEDPRPWAALATATAVVVFVAYGV